jgi:hypothetical protein
MPDWSGNVSLISSLRTNSSDEDLICFNTHVNTTLDPKTYIYNWLLYGQPYAEIIAPFDTNNNTFTRDYTGNNYNASVKDANWTSEGVRGGCYYLDGGSDFIEFPLPQTLSDISTNDFTLSIWVNSINIHEDQRVLIEGGIHKYFLKIMQFGEELHFGVCEDNVQYCVRTENLLNNTWYHIAAVWDTSEKDLAIYTNGVRSTEPGNRSFSQGVQDGLDIGHGTTSSRFWYGWVDEFQLFDRVLSDQQIYQLYLSAKNGVLNTDVMVSEQTYNGHIWQVVVTPNDSVQDGESQVSNPIQLLSYPGGD